MLDLKIALRNIARQKRRSFLSGLAMLGGYVLLSFSTAISEGSYANIIDIFTRDYTGHLQIHRQGYLDQPSLNKTIGEITAVTEALKRVHNIRNFSVRLIGPGLAYSSNKSLPAQVLGVDFEVENSTTRILQKIKAGRAPKNELTSDGVAEAAVGAGLAKNLNLHVGSELVLISQGGDGSVANDRFAVSGVIGTEDSRDADKVFLTLSKAREFFVLPWQAHEIAILVSHHNEALHSAEKLRKTLNAVLGPMHALTVEPWQQVEEEFYEAMMVDKKGNWVSYVIILFIVAVGVLNVVLMTILERTREFGVLKAIGTRPEKIFRLIVLETLVLGVLSVGMGLLIALPLNYWFQIHGINFERPIDVGGIPFEKMLAEVSWYSIAFPAAVVVASAVVVSVLPAWRAARIRVVDALRSV